MPEILVIKDVVRDTPFALVVKSDSSLSFYGFHEMGSDWAEHAQKTVSSEADIKAPEWTESTTFKSVSDNAAKSIIDKTLSKKIELNEFAEKVIKKTFASKTVFVGRTIINKNSEIETKSEKVDKNSSEFSKFDYRAKSFKNKIKKISLIKEAKSKKVSIDTKSGKFIDQRSEYEQSFESMKIQESAGFGIVQKVPAAGLSASINYAPKAFDFGGTDQSAGATSLSSNSSYEYGVVGTDTFGVKGLGLRYFANKMDAATTATTDIEGSHYGISYATGAAAIGYERHKQNRTSAIAATDLDQKSNTFGATYEIGRAHV
jgi:hypothetical protein